MTREEIRRENARRLCNVVGSKSAFGRRVGLDSTQVSQLIGPNPTKNIGNAIAHRIENAFEFPKGYLDYDHPEIAAMSADGSDLDIRDLVLLPESKKVTVDLNQVATIPIKKVALSLQAGVMGFEASQITEGDTTIDLPRQFIEENDLVAQCLLAISIKGDSMYPLMIDGDVVIINIADTRPKSGELYAVNYDGEAVVKQVVKDGPEWYLVSFNPAPEFRRRVCRGGECIIVGRVVRQEARKLIGRI